MTQIMQNTIVWFHENIRSVIVAVLLFGFPLYLGISEASDYIGNKINKAKETNKRNKEYKIKKEKSEEALNKYQNWLDKVDINELQREYKDKFICQNGITSVERTNYQRSGILPKGIDGLRFYEYCDKKYFKDLSRNPDEHFEKWRDYFKALSETKKSPDNRMGLGVIRYLEAQNKDTKYRIECLKNNKDVDYDYIRKLY